MIIWNLISKIKKLSEDSRKIRHVFIKIGLELI